MNNLLFRMEKEDNYVEVRATEKGYKLISFMSEYGRRETNYYDNEYFSKETKWSEEKLLKHAEYESSGVIESIEDMQSKIDLMPGLLKIDESIKEILKEAYLKLGSENKSLIIQFKFIENLPEYNKMLFAYCIVDSIIENTEALKELGNDIKEIEIQILE